MANLKVNNLSKSFGSTAVVNDISFNVGKGEFCILLGPSGCGKTTVLRLIAGLEHQDEGVLFIDNKEVSDLSPKERDVAMVFQSYALYPHMDVYENMAFSLKMSKSPNAEIDIKVREAAGLLGLEELLGRKPKELSGGQRQRVAIGRAIVREPKLFLFDEPLSNLDAILRSSMRVELAKLHHQLKATTLYVTHDQIEAMTLGEKIILMDRGEIQQIGTPEDMYNRPVNLFTATFIGTPQINLVQGTIAVKGDRAIFVSDDFQIDTGRHDELKQYEGKDVTIGIRPEALIPGEGPITGTVDLIENLGAEIILYIMTNKTRLVSKVPSGRKFNKGDDISLAINNLGSHFFSDGKRIGA